MTDELSDVLDAMHRDKSVVLRAQHTAINLEIGERQRITASLNRLLQEEILDLGSTILNLLRPDQPDAYLKERVTLEEHRRGLTRELRSEQLQAWRDVQELRREQRTIEHELTLDVQRRQRLEEMASAPRPL
jgi:hypothetical protein